MLEAISDVAAVQHGLITAAQLAEIGVSPATTRYRARIGGPWRFVLSGIYHVHSSPLTDEQRLHAAVLYARSPTMLTGATALALHGVAEAPRSQDVHLLVPHTRRRSSRGFVIVERTITWPKAQQIMGLPVAPLPRAVLDVTRRMGSPSQVRALVSGVVQQGRCTTEELADELSKAQRRGTRLVREAIELVAQGPLSVAEIDLYERWVAADLPDAVWNHDLHTNTGEFIATPDVFVPPAVVVEVDSRRYHSGKDDFERTMSRHNRMEAHGLKLLHYAPTVIRDRWPRVAAEIRATVEQFAASGARPPDVVVRPRASR